MQAQPPQSLDTPAHPAPHIPADAAWLEAAKAHGARHWLDNSNGSVAAIPLGSGIIPVTLTEDDPRASYVGNLLSAWVRYPVDEAREKLAPSLRLPVAGAAAALTATLRAAGLHRAALIDNWLISTNLHPNVSGADWVAAREAAIDSWPDRPLAIRSISAAVDPALAAHLVDDGWLLVPARLIYLCNPQDPATLARGHVKRDRKLLDRADVEIVGPEALTLADASALRRCFRMVFMEKHSGLNPDFSDAYFNLCIEQRYLDLYALRHDGQLMGVVGLLECHGWMTTPLIGYDTAQPAALGLYRRLMALLLDQARTRQVQLHYSSGAGQFKLARGGVPAMEYTALYVRHLPWAQRQAAQMFSHLLQRFAEPVLRRFG
jgi:hypothetical protein